MNTAVDTLPIPREDFFLAGCAGKDRLDRIAAKWACKDIA